jgi:hypothetical protein
MAYSRAGCGGLNRALLHFFSRQYLTPTTERMPPDAERRATLEANHHENAWRRLDKATPRAPRCPKSCAGRLAGTPAAPPIGLRIMP